MGRSTGGKRSRGTASQGLPAVQCQAMSRARDNEEHEWSAHSAGVFALDAWFDALLLSMLWFDALL